MTSSMSSNDSMFSWCFVRFAKDHLFFPGWDPPALFQWNKSWSFFVVFRMSSERISIASQFSTNILYKMKIVEYFVYTRWKEHLVWQKKKKSTTQIDKRDLHISTLRLLSAIPFLSPWRIWKSPWRMTRSFVVHLFCQGKRRDKPKPMKPPRSSWMCFRVVCCLSTMDPPCILRFVLKWKVFWSLPKALQHLFVFQAILIKSQWFFSNTQETGMFHITRCSHAKVVTVIHLLPLIDSSRPDLTYEWGLWMGRLRCHDCGGVGYGKSAYNFGH